MGSRSSAASDTTQFLAYFSPSPISFSIFLPVQIATMADRMWGGVPFTIPSSTAMKYLSGAVKVKRESALAPGGRYNARQTMEREIVGHRFARQDMNDSYENYATQKMRARTEPKLEPCTGVSKCKLSLRYPMIQTTKTYNGIGWTEPRAEDVLGFVDRRRHLPGYVGGRPLRESIVGGRGV